MTRIAIAFSAFFKALFNAEAAKRLESALKAGLGSPPEKSGLGSPPEKSGIGFQPVKSGIGFQPVIPPTQATPTKKPSPPATPTRSDAITLLALLQREARLIDLVQQPLTDFTDDQIGAAARDVITSTAAVLKRVFDIAPASNEEEGASITVPSDYDAGATTLSGNVPSTGPYSGKIVHAGWKARKCELPAWTGGKAAAMVIAPVEVEVG